MLGLIETLRGNVTGMLDWLILFDEKEKTVTMEFDALQFQSFVIQKHKLYRRHGGFVTGMLDASMAHLVIILEEFKYNPVSLDINVSFIRPAHPGLLIVKSRVLRMGKSIAFMYATMKQGEEMVASATSTLKLIPV